MWENFQLALHPIVLPFTVLLGLTLLYWLFVIFGIASLELFDIDLDIDASGDMDGGVDAPGDGVFVSALKFFHFGEVPVMIIMTIFALAMWSMSCFTVYYLRDETIASWIPIALIGPNILLSLVITRLVLLPFRKFFRSLNDDHRARAKIVGQICLITSSEVTDKFGIAEIAHDGPPIVIDVRANKGDEFRKGDAAVVDSFDKITGTYVVVPKRREV